MKKTGSLLYIILFMAMLTASLISMLLGYKAQNLENRPLARFPEIGRVSVLEFPSKFDRWFEDNFGLKEEMVTSFNGITLSVFSDTLNEKVIAGDGMLFYMETLDDYLGANLLSDADITRIATVLRLQSEYAKSIGASFAFTIAPNKNTIYPELMPRLYSRTGKASNRERLYAALDMEGVNTIDFAGLLLANKQSGLLYHPEDTHWNERGALLAYGAIMERLFPGADWADYSKIAPETKHDYGGDLHNFVLPAIEGKGARPEHNLETFYTHDKGARPAQDIAFGTTSGKNEARLYMFRDSFALALIPYISSNTGRTVYSSEFPYNYAAVPEEAPDAILIELVERNIKNLLISAPILPAIEAEAPKSATVMPAKIYTREKNVYTQVYGVFEGESVDASARIYVIVDGKTYEAFPVLEEGVDTEGYNEPSGFCVTLGNGGTGEYRVVISA